MAQLYDDKKNELEFLQGVHTDFISSSEDARRKHQKDLVELKRELELAYAEAVNCQSF